VKLHLFVGLAAIAAVAGCSTTSVEAPTLTAAERAAASTYLAAHSVDVPPDWHRGILITSRKDSYSCLGGTCWTWAGTVVTDTATVALRSVDNAMVIYDLVQPGDDFLWTKNPHPSYPGEVRVLTHGAVSPTR